LILLPLLLLAQCSGALVGWFVAGRKATSQGREFFVPVYELASCTQATVASHCRGWLVVGGGGWWLVVVVGGWWLVDDRGVVLKICTLCNDKYQPSSCV
jgi:hypothetical protein